MYRVTGKLQIVRKNKLREHRDGIMELIGYEDILQQEFRCEHYGNIEWRDVPIYTEELPSRQEAQVQTGKAMSHEQIIEAMILQDE